MTKNHRMRIKSLAEICYQRDEHSHPIEVLRCTLCDLAIASNDPIKRLRAFGLHLTFEHAEEIDQHPHRDEVLRATADALEVPTAVMRKSVTRLAAQDRTTRTPDR